MDLPRHLSPLLGDRPHLDVLGTTDPWVVPDGWLAETQAQIKALAEDPRSRWGERVARSWIDGTEPIIWFTYLASSLLPAPLPLWAGTYVFLCDILVAPWTKDQKIKTNRIALHWSTEFDDLWYLRFIERLLPDGPQARLDALDLTAEALAIFEPVPQFRARTQVLLSLLDRIRGDNALLRIHTEGAFPEIVRCWHSLATEEDIAIFPELAGTAATLAWGVHGLDTAHSHLAATVGAPQTTDELIASMAAYDKVGSMPPQPLTPPGYGAESAGRRRETRAVFCRKR